MSDALTPRASGDPPTPPPDYPRHGASVQLAGWRLVLAWAGLAVLVAWAVSVYARALPVYLAAAGWGDHAFFSLHIDAAFDLDPVRPMAGGVAEQAGMPAGRLLGVDGRDLTAEDTFLDAAARIRDVPGDTVRLRVVGAEGDTVTVAVPRATTSPPAFVDARYSHLAWTRAWRGLMLVPLLGFLLASFVLIVRQSRSWVALLAAGTFISAGLGSEVVQIADLVEGTDLASGPIPLYGSIPSLLVTVFLLVFPDGRVRPRWAWAVFAPAVALEAILEFGTGRIDPDSPVWVLAILLLILWVGTLIGAQMVRYRHATTVGRQQTKWALLGIAFGLGGGLVLGLALVPLRRILGIDPFTFVLVQRLPGVINLLLPAGVLLALLRYRLWDAESAWSRSAMAAALTLVLTAIVAGGTAFAQTALGAGGTLSLVLATAAAALVFVPLQRRLSDWADHRFLRDLTDLKTRLPDLVNHLRETESVEGIAEAVTDRVLPAVHATHIALVMPEGEGWRTVGTEGIAPTSVDGWAGSAGLAEPPAMAPRRRQPWRTVVWRVPEDRQFPVRVALRAERAGGETATEGWLLLGPRPDGSGYGPDDLEAVANVAGAVGRALRVVRVRESREAARADALDALRSELREGLRALRTPPPSPTP